MVVMLNLIQHPEPQPQTVVSGLSGYRIKSGMTLVKR
jgi:hypothetical protein